MRKSFSALTICHVAAVARLADDPAGEGGDEGELGEVCQESQVCQKKIGLGPPLIWTKSKRKHFSSGERPYRFLSNPWRQ